MTQAQWEFLRNITLACLTGKPGQKPSEWCPENLVFDEASNHGPFTTVGCEYIKDVLDDFANPYISDEVLVWGSQSRKTGTIMGGVAWCIVNDPCGFLWVMPTATLVAKFSRQRWQKLLKASGPTKNLIPTGAKRHDFSTSAQMLGASVVNLIGSNSPANLSSNPCRRVVLDEVDKFDEGGREEADAVNLAEQRTKDQRNPQRWKTSTPTLVSGLIWQEFLKGNQMRYFMPCPHCAKEVVFAWSAQYTVLPKTGCEAYVYWDKEAKVDWKWDLEKVKQSAHALCPHCKQKIVDGQKTKMIREGYWKATVFDTPKNFVSRHLSSLYACSPETSFGALAVKFLQMKNSLLGLQGFINGELAEPYMAQDTIGKRVEMVSARIEITAEWKKLMTVDCQMKSPHFWYVKRAWGNRQCEGIEASSCETWDEIQAIQKKDNIPDVCVMVDSGYGAMSDLEVYQNCARHCDFESRLDKLPLAIGWMPAKGMPGYKRWQGDEKLAVPYHIQPIDPFQGTSDAGQVEMTLFEFSSDFYKDILKNMRDGKAGFKWSVSKQMDNEDYWRHMDGEFKDEVINKKTGLVTRIWKRRSRYWPNHLLDCENMQISLAHFFGLVNIE